MIGAVERNPALTVQRPIEQWSDVAGALDDLAEQSRNLLVFRGLFASAGEADAMAPPPEPFDCWVVVENWATRAARFYVQLASGSGLSAGGLRPGTATVSGRLRWSMAGTLVDA